MIKKKTPGSSRRTKRPLRRAGARRPPLQGHWLDLSPQALEQPGAGLLMLIVEEARARALGPREVAAKLQISLQYYIKLRNGSAPAVKLSGDLLGRISRFLRIPKIVAMTLAEQVTVEDFSAPASELGDQVASALQAAVKDPKYALVSTPQIVTLPLKYRVWFARLYEDATGLKFIKDRIAEDAAISQTGQLVERAKLTKRTTADTEPALPEEPEPEDR